MYTPDGTNALCDELKITPRQLDYWLSSGYLTLTEPILDDNLDPQTPGSGNRRRFSEQDQDLIRAFAALVKAGLRPNLVGPVAEDLVTHREAALGPFILTLRS